MDGVGRRNHGGDRWMKTARNAVVGESEGKLVRGPGTESKEALQRTRRASRRWSGLVIGDRSRSVFDIRLRRGGGGRRRQPDFRGPSRARPSRKSFTSTSTGADVRVRRTELSHVPQAQGSTWGRWWQCRGDHAERAEIKAYRSPEHVTAGAGRTGVRTAQWVTGRVNKATAAAPALFMARARRWRLGDGSIRVMGDMTPDCMRPCNTWEDGRLPLELVWQVRRIGVRRVPAWRSFICRVGNRRGPLVASWGTGPERPVWRWSNSADCRGSSLRPHRARRSSRGYAFDPCAEALAQFSPRSLGLYGHVVGDRCLWWCPPSGAHPDGAR